MATRQGRAKQKGGGEHGTGAVRNRSKHAATKASYALEEVGHGKPSRKSTRRSGNRQKAGVAQKAKHDRAMKSPGARSASRGN